MEEHLMKQRLAVAIIVAAATAPALIIPAAAPAHRSGCHGAHSCPSDRATYRWRGKLCLSPRNGGNSGNGARVVYQGLTYYCHR
jgi:hypothetical protein